MSCVKCGDVCKCIFLESSDGSLIIDKRGTPYGCIFDIKQNGEDIYTLSFDEVTRVLCIKDARGAEINCVTIPDVAQTLTLQGNVLSITGGNSITLPDSPDLNISSSSLRVEQSGVGGFNVLLEVEPSEDVDNAIILGSDGKLYAPVTDQITTFDDPVTFNASVTANAPASFNTISATGSANLKGTTVTTLNATGNSTLKNTTLTDLTSTGAANLNDVTVNGQFGINQGGVVVYPNIYRGDYNASTLYFLNNIVTYNDKLWIYYATTASSGHTPASGSTYWKLYDESTSIPGQDGNSTEIRFAVNGSSTAGPAIVDTDTNPAGWALNPPTVSAAQYLWMTKAVKDSAGALVGTWSAPVRISGLVGPPGSNGADSNLPFKEFVFKRSATAPAAPTGGTWASPIPSGWSDGIPAGELQLWGSTRIFTSNGTSPQQATWSTPSAMTDTADIDYEWSSVATPGNPTDNPANWTDTASGEDIWMAIRKKTNGVWGAWSINKIKGENGTDANSAFKSIVFRRSTSTPATPTGGSYASPIPSGWSDGIPAGSFQLFESTRVFSSDGLSPQQASWTTPVAVTDTAYIDYEFSDVATSPGTPTTAPANWHDTGTEDDIWQAVRITKNGVAGDWQVVKIKGENGTDGAPGAPGELGPAGPFLSYAGNWQSTVSYYGNSERITAVFYNGEYYVTRTDAGGNIPAGTLPTNTLYWNIIDNNFESVATGLLLAQVAYINNLAVSFLRTGAPQAGVSGTEHIEIYPSFATLEGFRSQGEPGYAGLTDSDLHYLANSIIFFGINDNGARDEASVTSNMLSKYSALSSDPVTVNTDQFDSNGVPLTEAWNTGAAIRMQSGQYASVFSQQGYYAKDTTDNKLYSTLTSHYLVTPSATIKGELRADVIVRYARTVGMRTNIAVSGGMLKDGTALDGYPLQARSENSIILEYPGSGTYSYAPVLKLRNNSYDGTVVNNPVTGSPMYTYYMPYLGQVTRVVSTTAAASIELDTDVKIYRKDGTISTTDIALGVGESITIMATSNSELTGTAFIEL